MGHKQSFRRPRRKKSRYARILHFGRVIGTPKQKMLIRFWVALSCSVHISRSLEQDESVQNVMTTGVLLSFGNFLKVGCWDHMYFWPLAIGVKKTSSKFYESILTQKPFSALVH